MIRRSFATIGERQVHYRWAGHGPPVVALHQSPRDSEEMTGFIEALADRFTVIAPDTPGYGQSDPVAPADGDPDIDVFVSALAALLDTLGIRRAGLYGTHTGAIIATRFAARFPGRVSALVANGVLLLKSHERASMLAQYLTPLHPRWDGGHLAWVWSRLRDQSVFYPWYERDPARRIHWRASLAELNSAALDLLEAGDHYRTAYRAAIGYPIEYDLAGLKPPACFLFAGTDALAKHAAELPSLAGGAELRMIGDFAEAPAAARAFFSAHLAEADALRLPETGRLAHRAGSRMVDAPEGQVHVRANLSTSGRPLVLLHDLGDSSGVLRTLIGGLIGRRPVIAPDLTGHGESLPFAGEPSLQAAADHAAAALQALGLDECDLVAFGGAEPIAARIAQALPRAVRGLVVCNSLARHSGASPRDLVPSLAPEVSGAHLQRAWTYVRDRDLYWPWFDPFEGEHLAAATPANPYALADRLLACLKAAACHGPLLEQAIAADMDTPRLRLATAAHPSRAVWPDAGGLADDPCGWAGQIIAALGQA